MLYPQNGDRILIIDSVALLYPVYHSDFLTLINYVSSVQVSD